MMKPITFQVNVRLDDAGQVELVKLIREAIAAAGVRPFQAGSGQPASSTAALSTTPRDPMMGGETLPEDVGLLIDNRQAAKLLNVSARKLWDMHHTGRMPQPIRLGRIIRWSVDELKSWVDAGCPNLSSE